MVQAHDYFCDDPQSDNSQLERARRQELLEYAVSTLNVQPHVNLPYKVPCSECGEAVASAMAMTAAESLSVGLRCPWCTRRLQETIDATQ